ncbi:MAG: phosphoglucomutase/phosphomannomutase family protein, partial [Anaerolineales bacterium]|nr:phosphoglucomutase/phosphomannomutase family protein [Anaerolineales bacterium]
DGVLMGLLLIEMVAVYGKSLHTLVKELLDDVGPAFYERKDQRLKYPIEKNRMVQYLLDNKPAEIGGVKVSDLITIDGVKYIMADDSWLLIRPSGTEPVLRVYAEGRSEQMVQALLGYGEEVAESIT